MTATHMCPRCGLVGVVTDALGLQCPCGGVAVELGSPEHKTWADAQEAHVLKELGLENAKLVLLADIPPPEKKP